MPISREKVNNPIEGLGWRCWRAGYINIGGRFRQRRWRGPWFPASAPRRLKSHPALGAGYFKATSKLSVSMPTSRWVITTLVLVNKFNRVFNGNNMAFGIAVAVANHGGQRSGLPVPVAPTNIIKPRLVIASSLIISGRPKSSILGILVSMRRNTIPAKLRW